MTEIFTQDLLNLAPPPTDEHQRRIVFFTRCLAYGVLKGLWSPRFAYDGEWIAAEENRHQLHLKRYLEKNWSSAPPSVSFLEVFEYIRPDGGTTYVKGVSRPTYILTPAAFDLLQEPATPPSVFIAYKRDESSALGLLLVARMKMVGVPNPFIDMNIAPGAEWQAQLQRIIEQAEYCIVLIAPTTLDSEYVCQEIAWAQQSGAQLIPIWHSGFHQRSDFGRYAPWLQNFLNTTNAIIIRNESAADYENAVTLLLNRLGYSP
jgi:hypothetical protein